jgi:hypothetical protein
VIAIYHHKNKTRCIDTCMNDIDFFSLGDVARILRCQPYQMVYLISTRQVPEPRLRIGGKRIFRLTDIHRIAEKLQVALAQELVAKGQA